MNSNLITKMKVLKFAVVAAFAPAVAIAAPVATQTLTFASGVTGSPFIAPSQGLSSTGSAFPTSIPKISGDYVGQKLGYSTSFAGVLNVTSSATTDVSITVSTRTNPNGSWISAPSTNSITVKSALVIQDISPSKGGLGVENKVSNDDSPFGDNVGLTTKTANVDKVTGTYRSNPTSSKPNTYVATRTATTTKVAESLIFNFDKAVALNSLSFFGDHTAVNKQGTFDFDYLGLNGSWENGGIYGLNDKVSFTGVSSKGFRVTSTGTDFYVGAMTVSAVPEPETYAMFLAGLGLMGAVARRRASKQV